MRCVAHLIRDQSEDIEDADTFWSSCAMWLSNCWPVDDGRA
jgi:hypothetical protein